MAAAALVGLTFPGALVGALVAHAIWGATTTPSSRRVLTAGASAGLLLLLRASLLTGWAWRLAGLGLVSAPGLGLSVVAVLRSIPAEATLGPALALLFEASFALRRRTVIGQIEMASRKPRDSRQRAPALQPGYRPSGQSAVPADGLDGIYLGLDPSGQPFSLGVEEIAQHIFLPGATGSGKTTTLVRVANGALANGYSVAVVDGKAGSLLGDCKRVADRQSVPFVCVHPDEPNSVGYDVCAGDGADVANKLIGAFPFEAEADIYKQIAMQAIPVVVNALRAGGNEVTLHWLSEALAKNGFGLVKRSSPPEFHQALDDLLETTRDDLAVAGYAGLRYRLRAISVGKFGDILVRRPALDWSQVSSAPGVTYIGLPTTAVAEDVELFGRVIVQDLKQLCARRLRALGRGEPLQPMLIVFDEFTALRDAPQIRDLLLQSRQALMPTVVAQQYLPLDKEIRASVLQSGVLLCHRLNAEDAEAIANELGTQKRNFLTSQVDFETGEVNKGSVRAVDEYVIHPNKLRTLPTGRAVVLARPSERREVVHIHRDE